MYRSRFAIAFLFTSALIVSGCSTQSADDGHGHAHTAGDGHDHGTAAPTQAAQHGSATAVAGSYEDWCGEHAVPESKCTRCNTALVAAFKATGDWCAEHGLPESHCVKCDPSRKMTRPPKSAAK